MLTSKLKLPKLTKDSRGLYKELYPLYNAGWVLAILMIPTMLFLTDYLFSNYYGAGTLQKIDIVFLAFVQINLDLYIVWQLRPWGRK
jgi:hypothetical protein